MEKLTKENILTAIAVVLLFATALINWTFYSWLVLLAILLIIFAWYFKNN